MKTSSRIFILSFLMLYISCLSSNKQSNHSQDTDKNNKDNILIDSLNTHKDSISPDQDSIRIPRPKNVRKISERWAKKYGKTTFETPGKTIKSITQQGKDDSVSMIVLKESIPYNAVPDTIRLRLFNYSADTILTGLHYNIEHWRNNSWSKIKYDQNLDLVIEDIGYLLKPQESADYIIQLYNDLYDFKKGKYRVSKYYISNKQIPPKTQHDIYAQFEIK